MIAFGENPIDSLLFASPIVADDIDFANDWIVNPENGEGVTIEGGTVTITKVKPKEWILRSNYGFADYGERDAWGLKARFKFSGLQALWGNAITYNEDHPIMATDQTYRPIGLVITPIRTSDGMQFSHVYPWEMNIPGGKFKHVYGYSQSGHWSVYGYGYDQIEQPYNWTCGGYSSGYLEIGFALWTGTAPDDGEYLTLTNPIVIEAKCIYPVSVEGFSAFVGSNPVFAKPKTVANTLIKWGIAPKESGSFVEKIQNQNVQIQKSGYQSRQEAETGISEAPYAFVTHGDGGEYARMILPSVSDIAARITEGFPLKYWCMQYDKGNDAFWKSVIDAFASTPISDVALGQCLFPLSNIESGFSDKGAVKLTFDGQGQYFILDRAFDHCDNIDKVHITLIEGYMQSLLCLFRATPNLSEVVFNPDGGTIPRVSQWSGSFERSALQNWPSGLGVDNREGLNDFSEGVCDVNYAFDNSSLKRVGDYRDENGQTENEKYWIARVAPYCVDAFYNSALTEIRYLLDMKFVVPNSSAHQCLLSSSIASARIKNLNKGDWSLDNVTRNGCRAANFVNLDSDSVNYLLENVFDLRQNPARAETDYNPIGKWTVIGGSVSSRGYNDISFYGTEKPQLQVNSSIAGTVQIIANSSTVKKFRLYNAATGWVNHEFYTAGINTMALSIGTGINVLEVNESPSEPYGVSFAVDGTEVALSERSQVTEANLYCPANWADKIQASSAQEAQIRGWHIYIDNTLVVY